MKANLMEAGEESYAYKPSLIGAPWIFQLTPDAIEWRVGPHHGRTPYAQISRIRLSFRPTTMQGRRFVTDIWPSGGPRLSIASASWKTLMEQETKDLAYGNFIRELHRRVAAANVAVSFETGSPAILYWPGLAIFAAGALGLAGLTVHALHTRAWAGAAVVGGFLGLFLWQSGNYFRRNRPGTYRPDALPEGLVP